MKLFPAIDLKDGAAVRLFQGDYDKMTLYSDDPVKVAKGFAKDGAEYLHLVDLDGAKDGTTQNFATIEKIVAATGMFCEVGGGIRSEKRIKAYLNLGVKRVILGTAAVKNLSFLQEMVDKYGDAIAVGVDAKNGFVATDGWKIITDVESFAFCEKLRSMGVKTVIYTDIAKDGGLSGTNLPAYKKLAAMKGLSVTASGGISSLAELVTLQQMGTDAAILGKAIYAGVLDLKTALDTVNKMLRVDFLSRNPAELV